MDELVFEVRQQDDPSRESPGRLVGTLLRYSERARDRAEIFLPGSLSWDQAGIVINEQHNRAAPIVRAVPFLDGDEVKIDAAVPSTQRGRDAIANIKAGVWTALSVEFRATSEGHRGGVREIRSAVLGAAALVDTGAYRGSKVEVRARDADRRTEGAYRWL